MVANHASDFNAGSEPLGRVLQLLKGVRRSGEGHEAHCPAHEDERRSLSVGRGKDGCVLLKCHAGCTTEAVLAALGLTVHDLFAAPAANGACRRIVATYDYQDEAGCLRFQVVRFHPKDFRQRRPDGRGGWAWGLGGRQPVLYRLPELLAAPAGETVFVPEGEKDVGRLRALGLVATTNPMGAGKWRQHYNEALRGRRVVVLADKDDAGRDHARQVAEALGGVAASVAVLELPGLPDKGDVSDWLNAGGTKEKLLELARQEQAGTGRKADAGRGGYRLATTSAAELCTMDLGEVRFTIDGLLPEGAVVLAGPPKVGKSWLALDLAMAAAASAQALGSFRAGKGAVLYLALEDGPRRMQGRLKKVLALWGGTAPPGLHFAYECPRAGGGGLSAIRAWLDEHPDRTLVVVDTLARMRDRRVGQTDIYGADYEDIAGLQALAMEYGVTVLIIHHTRKGRGEAPNGDQLERVSGTLGLTGAADAVLVLRRKRHEKAAQLFITGRDVEERELELRWEPQYCHWEAVAEAQGPDAGLDPDRRAVRQAVRQAGRPLSIGEVMAALKAVSTHKDYEATAKLLQRMEHEGNLKKAGRGRYDLPDDDVSKQSNCPDDGSDEPSTG
jgi:hypothetical protein